MKVTTAQLGTGTCGLKGEIPGSGVSAQVRSRVVLAAAQ